MRPFPIILTLVVLAGCAREESVPEEGTQDLIGGSAADTRYNAVGALVEDNGVFCTATLVTKTLVVTAKHCIEGGSEENPEDHVPAKVTFRLGASASAPTRAVKLKRWIAAPDFDKPDYASYASDVTLAELTTPITDIAPIPIAQTPVADTEIGTAFDLVGFGVRTVDGLGKAEGKREVGSFTLEATNDNAFAKRFGSKAAFDTFFAKLDPAGHADDLTDRIYGYADLFAGYEVLARSTQSESCYADSGGPLLRHTATGTLEIVGVVSSGFPGYASSCLQLGTVFAVFGPRTSEFFRASIR